MQIIELSDLTVGDGTEDKYWRFVGQDWIWINMDAQDQEWCEANGKKREDYGNSITKRNFAKAPGSNTHTMGLAGEMAASLFTGKPINQILLKNHALSDIGDDIESKTSTWRYKLYLTINKSQMKRDWRYILTLTKFYPKTLAIVGWCYGRDVTTEPKMPKFRNKEMYYVRNLKRGVPRERLGMGIFRYLKLKVQLFLCPHYFDHPKYD
jgi:hypothetical protein